MRRMIQQQEFYSKDRQERDLFSTAFIQAFGVNRIPIL
jgi:hypothetical protein